MNLQKVEVPFIPTEERMAAVDFNTDVIVAAVEKQVHILDIHEGFEVYKPVKVLRGHKEDVRCIHIYENNIIRQTHTHSLWIANILLQWRKRWISEDVGFENQRMH